MTGAAADVQRVCVCVTQRKMKCRAKQGANEVPSVFDLLCGKEEEVWRSAGKLPKPPKTPIKPQPTPQAHSRAGERSIREGTVPTEPAMLLRRRVAASAATISLLNTRSHRSVRR